MALTTSLQLTPDQRETFISMGYLRLPQVLSPNILEELRRATRRLCAQGKDLPEAAVIQNDRSEDCVIGIEKIAALSEPLFREILGSPLLLSLAQSICGDDFFPVQDFIVIKSAGDGNTVNWHQDILTRPLGKAVMIGFYLDPADDQNGALRVIPGSHRSGLPICELEKMDYTAISMEAGDILVHDLMLAHSSGALSTREQRRVVYFEFMSAQQAIEEGIYPEPFVTTRRELLTLAATCFSEAHQTNSAQAPQPGTETTNAEVRIRELYALNRKRHVANYCFEQLYQ